jgi:hypothetical protein
MMYFEEYEKSHELDERLQNAVIRFREYVGYPCTITSGYAEGGHSDKSEHYNKNTKGEPASFAVDITTKAPLWWAYICAERAKIENIGIYPTWNGLHLGVRGNESRRWIGTGSGNEQVYLPFCIDKLADIFFKKA